MPQTVPVPAGSTVGAPSGAVPVPADATVGSPSVSPTPTSTEELSAGLPQVSARPGGIGDWLEDFEADLRYGGDRTALGRLLKKAGAQGLNVGAQAAAGDYMGSPELGLTHMAEGFADPDPIRSARKMGQGAWDAATIPLQFMAPEAGEELAQGGAAATRGAAKVAGKAWEAVPSLKRASENFDKLMAVAKDLPINHEPALESAQRAKEMADAGGHLPKVISDFLQDRKAAMDVHGYPGKPMTLQKARDFYSNATRLTWEEAGKMNGSMRHQLGDFTGKLGEAIEDTANNVGKGQEYSDAMRDWHRAMQLRDFLNASLQQASKHLPWMGAGYLLKQWLSR